MANDFGPHHPITIETCDALADSLEAQVMLIDNPRPRAPPPPTGDEENNDEGGAAGKDAEKGSAGGSGEGDGNDNDYGDGDDGEDEDGEEEDDGVEANVDAGAVHIIDEQIHGDAALMRPVGLTEIA